MTGDERLAKVAEVIWRTSRADESTISATGANIVAQALAPLLDEFRAEDEARGRLVRQVESDMAEQAAMAWRSADARRGLSDHEALLVHADALTRWSERLRMAFEGEDYRVALAAAEPDAGERP